MPAQKKLSRGKLLSIGEAALYLGVSSKTLRRWDKKGVLQPIRTEGNQRRFSIDELEKIKNGEKTALVSDTPQPFSAHFVAAAGITALTIIVFFVFFLIPYGQSKLDQFRALLKESIQSELRVDQEEENIAGLETIDLGGSGNQVVLSPLSENLIMDASFERAVSGIDDKGGFGQAWRWGYLEMGHQGNIYVSNEAIHSGTLSLTVYDSLYDTQPESDVMSLGVTQKETTTINGRNYILSVWLRTKDLVGNPTVRLGVTGEASSDDPNYGGSGWTEYSQDKYRDFTINKALTNQEWQQYSFSYTNAVLGKYPFIQILNYRGGKIFLDDVIFVETKVENLAQRNEQSFFSLSTFSSDPLFQQTGMILADGSIVVDSFGHLYPADTSTGSLGMPGNRFASLYIDQADLTGNLRVGGDISLEANLEVSGAATIAGELTINNNINIDSLAVSGNVTMPDDGWIGLGSSGGRIEFDDQSTDEVNVLSANVGIGTTSPHQKLEIVGTAQMTGFKLTTSPSTGYVLTSDADGVGTWTDVSSTAGPWSLSGNNLYPDSTSYNVAIGATDAGTAKFYVNGNVGIGTTGPGYKLEVNGTGYFADDLKLPDDKKLLLGTGADGEIYSSSDNLYIANVTQDKDIYFQMNDGGSTTTPLFIDGSTSYVGIGTTEPSEKLTVDTGNVLLIPGNPTYVGKETGHSGAYDVFILGEFAYVTTEYGGEVDVVRITDPVNPYWETSDSGSILTSPKGLYVSGGYLYVAEYAVDGVEIFEIDADAVGDNLITSVGYIQDGGSRELNGADDIFVSGKYAYVAAALDDGVEILDVSDSANPAHVGAITDDGTTALSGATAIYVSGRYAYVGSSEGLEILDISDPTNPTHKGSFLNASSSILNGVDALYVSAGFVYAVSKDGGGLSIIDATWPNSPSEWGTLSGLGDPRDIKVAGDYAYIVKNNGFYIVKNNINYATWQANPAIVGQLIDDNSPDIGLYFSYGVFVRGKYAYVASHSDNALVVIDIASIDAPAGRIDFLSTESLEVEGDLHVGENISASLGLNVGHKGIFSGGPVSVFSGGSSSAAALDIWNSSGNSLLFVENSGNVGIGTTGPVTPLEIPGSTTNSSAKFGSFELQSYAVNNAWLGENAYYNGGFKYRADGAATLFYFGAGGLSIRTAPSGSAGGGFSYETKLKVAHGTGVGFGDNIGSGMANANMVVQENGNVGIGTTNPGAKLDIAGDASASGSLVFRGNSPATIDVLNDARLDFQTSVGGDAGLSPVMTITNTGDLGIGEVNPDQKLHLNTSSSNVAMRLQIGGGATTFWDIGLTSGTTGFSFDWEETVTPLFLEDIAQIGIGTTSPQANLHIFDDFWWSSDTSILLDTDGTDWHIAVDDSESDQLVFGTGQSVGSNGKMVIDSNGNVGVGTTDPSWPLEVNGGAGFAGDVWLLEEGKNPRYFTGDHGDYGLFMEWCSLGDYGKIWTVYSGSGGGNLVLQPDTGNLGVGTTTPETKFHIVSEEYGFFHSYGSTYLGTYVEEGYAEVGTFSNTDLSLSVNDGNMVMILTTDGNVGIGTDEAPTAELDLVGDASASGSLVFRGSSPTVDALNDTDLHFQTSVGGDAGLSPVMTITGAGNIGIGTTEPSEKLDVNGNARFRSVVSGTYANDLNITADGTLTTASSDVSLKTNLEAIEGGLDKVLQLQGYYFNWIDDFEGQKDIGLIAQEVAPFLPELVFTNPVDGLMGINYSRLSTVLIEATKEQQAQIDNLFLTLDEMGNVGLGEEGAGEGEETAAEIGLEARILDLEIRSDFLEEKYATLSAQLADLETLVLLDDLETTVSSELVLDQLDVETATVSGSLNVLGPAIVSDLGITGDITAGLLVINGLEAEIESLGEALVLQPRALGDLEIMAGKVVVDTHGNLVVQGTITAEKIAVEEFKILGAESAGSAVLLAGETSVEVAAEAASDSAKILLTPTTLTDKILVVTEKEPSKFKVEITEPEEKEINFDWFIIQ